MSSRDDTIRETPAAKASDPRMLVPSGDWLPPRGTDPGDESERAARDDRAPLLGGARLDIGLGTAQVRSFQVKGPLAVALTVALVLVVGVVLALVFVFAIGVGGALAAGAAVAAALGMGVARLRRQLTGRSPGTLDACGRERLEPTRREQDS